MLYASIALVVAGLVLIVYSFAARNRHGQFGAIHGEVVPEAVTETVSESDRPVAGTADTAFEKHDTAEKPLNPAPPSVREPVKLDEKTVKPAGTAQRASRESAPAGVEKEPVGRPDPKKDPAAQAKGGAVEEKDVAILYADSSGVVDYESGANIIDPTFKKYSKLRRIGKGKIEIIKDGLNFQLRKKLYRFDFYRIQRMVTGKNYLALFLKGSDEVRLMIFEGEGTSHRRIINEFNSFKKRSI